MHPFLEGQRPIVMAHRGYSAVHPENSMAAFAAAVEMGCRYVETDVHATADGVLVAFHDDTLDRVTDSIGALAQLPWSQVREARIGGTEPIPRFEELLAAWPDLRVNVDVKSAGAIMPLVVAIEKAQAHDRICVGSFSGRRRIAVMRRLTRLPATSASPERLAAIIAAVRGGLPEGTLRALFHGIDCVQIPLEHKGIQVFSKSLLEAVHAAGVQVHIWTVDDPAEQNRLVDLGVDGIITNSPHFEGCFAAGSDVLRDVSPT